jgi:ribonucleoside-diphosphate reductase alpha chain
MQTAETSVHATNPMANPSLAHDRAAQEHPTMLTHYQIIRRNGAVVPFEPAKIAVAMMKAFLAVHGTQGAASASVREMVEALTQGVVRALMRSRPGGGTFHIEDVQDQVELGLMRGGHHEIARAYVLYRERRNQERAHIKEEQTPAAPALHVIDNGQRVALDLNNLKRLINDSCAGLGADVKPTLYWQKPCATCTTASPWTRCTKPPSWPHAH